MKYVWNSAYFILVGCGAWMVVNVFLDIIK